MNIDYERLQEICLAPIEAFTSLGKTEQTRDGLYIYRENPNAKILAVAHLDSVLDLNHFYLIHEKHDTTVINAQLDDRLGVYVLLDILPQLGIEFDLLLTEGEESGHSTAVYFESSKKYNWMFSFDRRLNDVVLYKYEDSEICKELSKAGFRIGLGSFSDICFLSHLGIRGFNVGTGYNGEHSAICHASMSMLFSQVGKFAKFYTANKDRAYPYTRTHQTRFSFSKSINDECYLCHAITPQGEETDEGIYICDRCYPDTVICAECDDYVLSTDTKSGICSYCRNFQDVDSVSIDE